MIALTDRPRLAARARLRRDRFSAGHLLLYPERGLALNASAAAIVRLCDGTHTVAAIAERVAGDSNVATTAVVDAVQDFLQVLAARGLLVEA